MYKSFHNFRYLKITFMLHEEEIAIFEMSQIGNKLTKFVNFKINELII